MKVLLYVWAFPNTLIGLLAVCLARFGKGSEANNIKIVDGVIEAHSGWLPKLFKFLVLFTPISGIAAITLGHVTIGQNQNELDRCRKHEQVHVRQYERWGIFFLPAYFASSFVAFLKNKDPYLDNVFEVEAYAIDNLVDEA